MKEEELREKLKELTLEGYIEPEQLQCIEREYFKEGEPDKKLMLSFALLGVLFVGIGLISICAFNWYYIPPIMRIIFAFIPLIGMQVLLYWQYKKEASRIWIESLCLGVGLAFLLAMGLIYQVYQVSIGVEIIFLITFLAMIPAIYCCDAYYLSILCLIGVVFYSLLEGIAFYNILVILIFPYYIKCLKNKRQVGILTLAIILWSLEFLYITLDYFGIHYMMSYMLLFILLTRIKCHPLYRWAGLIAFYFLNFWIILLQPNLRWSNPVEFLPVIVFFMILGYSAYTNKNKNENIETGILLLQPVLIGIWGVIGQDALMILIFNIYAVGCMIYLLLIKGDQEKSVAKLRAGSLLLCIYALLKLFSADIALLGKGIGFIIAGSILLGANIWLNHHLKGAQNE